MVEGIEEIKSWARKVYKTVWNDEHINEKQMIEWISDSAFYIEMLADIVLKLNKNLEEGQK